MIMRFRPANISLINRRHYLPRLLLTLSAFEKNDQRILTGHYISALQQFLGVQIRMRFRLGDHPLFTPLVFCGVHGFADAISKGQHIRREELKHLLRVGRAGKQADDGATAFQAKHPPGIVFFAKYRRRIVSAIDVVQRAPVAVQFGVEERGIAVGAGRVVEKAVDLAILVARSPPPLSV